MALEYLDLEENGVGFLALLNVVKNLGSIVNKDFWKGTQAEYDALESYNTDTLYFIQEEVSS